MPPSKPDPLDTPPQLPFDFYRTPSTKAELACHPFRLALPAAASAFDAAAVDSLLAAAFGVLLSRYNTQASIVLNASRITAAGEIRWRRPLELSTTLDSICERVLGQAGDFFRRGADGMSAEASSESSRAAITFLELKQTQESHESPDALKIVASSALASRNDDLQLVIAHAGGNIHAAFLYNPNLFKRTSVERIAGHFKELLARLVINGSASIYQLPFMTPAERKWIELVCSGRSRESRAEYVHHSFEKRAAEAPEAPALRYRDHILSYADLNAQANRLARHLSSKGIGAESRIVVCLEPSFDIVIALLAVLKAGAIYVPLDPTYPRARITSSLEDIQPSLVITRARLLDKISLEDVPTMTLEEFEGLATGLSAENPELEIQAEQTAYIYYTSGTTGKPKGAAASQANLASYIHVARERYQIGKSDVMPALARFTFSISMFELMSPLAAGGTLILLDRDHILDLDRMSRTLEEVTFFHAGPSLLRNLIVHIKRRGPSYEAFARVRHASSGGDMVSTEVLEGLKHIFSKAEIFVIYGCSEISCMGCTYPVARDRPVERTYVGRPFDNMAVRVLDHALNLVPVGVVGEIYFAGDGIVKGYLNRPELTAEKFVELDGRRYYRTGDMGRLSEDGWIEILGRSDFQVKLRGIRIELGEVEHNLRRAPGVRDGAVMTRRTEGGENALIAYVVMERSGHSGGTAAIHRYMVDHVPDYMVPAAYVTLEGLPLNHNMKVDRHALPDPEAVDFRIASCESFREPRTQTEQRLAALWMKLLGTDRVSLDDHFFDLGGHSLLGTQLILDVENELGVMLNGMEILRESLEEQASICDRRLGRERPAPVSSEPGSPVPASDSMEAIHFGDKRELYGVFSAGSARAPREAVLICSSVGQEHFRAHFVLRRLALRLAAQGVPALRFDYYGCGDSLGESADSTCGRWQRDIADAARELSRLTGAARITAVGLRLGAALLAHAAEGLEIDRLVLWDPVCDGAEYLAGLADAHGKLFPAWRRLLRGSLTRESAGTELIGLACSDANVSEIKALTPTPLLARRRYSLKWLATSGVAEQTRRFQSVASTDDGSRFEAASYEAGWNDIARIGDLLPDAGISTTLAAMATERS